MNHASKTPSFRPHKLALAVALALGGPSAWAANFYVGVGADPGDSDPATLDCSNSSNGTCTLSAAIRAANQAGGSNTITLNTDVIVNGVMKRLIDSNITLQSNSVTCDFAICGISGSDTYRPLFIKSGTVTIRNLNLTHGKAHVASKSSCPVF
ncbi:exported hypothetical protein [Gammaproteobacteria bacterium]